MNIKRIATVLILFTLLIACTSVAFASSEVDDSGDGDDSINVDDEYDEYKRAFVTAVSVDVDEYAKKHFDISVKKTLTIPKWLNDMAVSENINFSQLLQSALKEKLNVS